jgi:lipoyl(octanoyl) transferase
MVKNRHQIIPSALTSAQNPSIDYLISDPLVSYEKAVADMEMRVGRISDNQASELIWLLEHPALYTAGTSANATDLLTPERFPVHKTGRGGQFTYHGPGQRVAYVMLNLKHRTPDVRLFVAQLEEVLIRTLKAFDVIGERREDRVGVWVRRPDKGIGAEDKIAAIGIRVRKWVTFHGISLNVNPDLEHFSGIIACGVQDHGTTSLHDLGKNVSMQEVDHVLLREFTAVFGSQLNMAIKVI